MHCYHRFVQFICVGIDSIGLQLCFDFGQNVEKYIIRLCAQIVKDKLLEEIISRTSWMAPVQSKNGQVSFGIVTLLLRNVFCAKGNASCWNRLNKPIHLSLMKPPDQLIPIPMLRNDNNINWSLILLHLIRIQRKTSF